MTDQALSKTQEPVATQSRQPRFGLSGKLLLLTVIFVMIAEVLIYVPSIANFRINWLRDRLAAAQTAALVFDAAPVGMVPNSLSRQILSSIGARALAIKLGTERRLLAVANMPLVIEHDVDIRELHAFRSIVDAFEVLADSGDEVIRVVGPAPAGGEFVEVLLDEAPLRAAMLRFSVNILVLSLMISVITAAFVYMALHYLFVRPMRRMTANLVAFHADPESPAKISVASKRSDEIGVVERELSGLQRDLVSMLNQKSRLAALGLAVSKINHDLRNLLSAAQLISDQFANVSDPHVQRFAPRLMQTLERAIAFCQSTLSYGRAQESAPDRRMISLEAVVADVQGTLALATKDLATWVNAVEQGLMVDADRDQLFRILLNLARNAVQALEARGHMGKATNQIRVSGRREGAVVVIEVSDTGPGFPTKAREHLFEAFQGGTRAGGTGLGLAIAAELVRAHGGEIALVEGTIGATFRITIPDRPVELQAHRIRA